MARSDQAARLAPYARELIENEYVQENLREGVKKLRVAYQRARKRRVEPTRDERLRRQLRSAAQSLGEAGKALRNRRRKPKPRWGTRAAVLVGLGVATGAVVLWAKQRLGEQSAAPAAPTRTASNGADRVPESAAA
jgi:hypothetical protein